MKITKLLLSALAFAAMTASCSSGGDTPTPDPTGKIYISAATNAIKADGKDEVELIVMKGDVDITAQSQLFKDGETTPLSSNKFSTATEGSYGFYAVNGNDISSTVTVRALSEIPALPTDPQPTTFDGFAQRVLIVKFTGTGCQYCPYGMATFHDLELTEYDAKIAIVEDHAYNTSDPMYSKDAEYLGRANSFNSAPSATYNLRTSPKLSFSDNIATNVSKMKSDIDKAISTNPAKCGIAASAKLVGSKVFVSVSAKVKEAGNYKVAVWLLEDGINAKQTNSTQLVGYDFNTHYNALRPSNITSQTDVPGSPLSVSGYIAANQEVKTAFSLPWNDSYVAANCKVVVVVTTPDTEASTKYYANNSIICKLNDTQAYEYSK